PSADQNNVTITDLDPKNNGISIETFNTPRAVRSRGIGNEIVDGLVRALSNSIKGEGKFVRELFNQVMNNIDKKMKTIWMPEMKIFFQKMKLEHEGQWTPDSDYPVYARPQQANGNDHDSHQQPSTETDMEQSEFAEYENYES
ncbi:hypothetical protein QAD02_011936, partial [Eretmocerus hayati]